MKAQITHNKRMTITGDSITPPDAAALHRYTKTLCIYKKIIGKHIMKNHKYIVLVLILMLFGITRAWAGEVELETLLKAQLEGVEGTEIIVSKVYIPANSSLPKHWHPGEEFVYILEGNVTLWQKGKNNITANEGEVIKVPLKQVHTGITGNEGVSLLVFRVHEQGQPERVKAE